MATAFQVNPRHELSAMECRELASIHCDALPFSVPALLGGRYAASFYQAANRSATEYVITASVDDRTIIGGALASTRPDEIGGRMLRKTLPGMVLGALRTLIGGTQAKRSALCRAMLSPPAPPGRPELFLIYLFVGEAHRGRGVGQAILEVLDRLAAELGFSMMRVLTEDDPGNLALDFYARYGFIRGQGMRHGGRDFVILERAATPRENKLKPALEAGP